MKKFRLIIMILFPLIISVNTFASEDEDRRDHEKFKKLFEKAKAPTEIELHLGAYLGTCSANIKSKKGYSGYVTRPRDRNTDLSDTKVYLVVSYDKEIDRIVSFGRSVYITKREYRTVPDWPLPILEAWDYLLDNDLKSYLWTLYKNKPLYWCL